MGNLYCKIFGHSKTHWPVGLGGSAVFVWCSTCGKEFENESLEMRNHVHKLEHEVKELNRVINYYKSSNDTLQQNLNQYIDIVTNFCESRDSQYKWIAFEGQPEYPFKDEEYYHLGCKGSFSGDFVYQGIFKHNNGFLDSERYHLKPFPTHYIHITSPKTQP